MVVVSLVSPGLDHLLLRHLPEPRPLWLSVLVLLLDLVLDIASRHSCAFSRFFHVLDQLGRLSCLTSSSHTADS